MSDYGQMIDPYRVPPPQGDLMGALQDILLRQQQVGALRRAEDEKGATNMLLNQQNGWNGVDPMQMQTFNKGAQDMRIAGATEDRTAQTYRQNQDFAQQYTGANQERFRSSQDPMINSVAGMPANPVVVGQILQQLGLVGRDDRQFQNQQTLQGSQQNFVSGQNEADRAAAAARQEAANMFNMNLQESSNLAADSRQQAGFDAQTKQDQFKLDAMKKQTQENMSYAQQIRDGKMSLVDMAASGKYTPDQIQQIGDLLEVETKAKRTQAFIDAENGRGGSTSIGTASAQNRQDADRQRQTIKDNAFNVRNKLWTNLPEGEFEQVYAKGPDGQPFVTPKGQQLLDRVREAIASGTNEGKGPDADYYKTLVPHIYEMVGRNMPREERKNPVTFWDKFWQGEY